MKPCKLRDIYHISTGEFKSPHKWIGADSQISSQCNNISRFAGWPKNRTHEKHRPVFGRTRRPVFEKGHQKFTHALHTWNSTNRYPKKMGLGTYISFQTVLFWVPSQKTNISQLEKFGKSSTQECRFGRGYYIKFPGGIRYSLRLWWLFEEAISMLTNMRKVQFK